MQSNLMGLEENLGIVMKLCELRVFKARIKEKKTIGNKYLILFEFCDDSVKVIKQPPLPRGVELSQYNSVKEEDIIGVELYRCPTSEKVS